MSGDYSIVAKDIASILSQPGYDDGSLGPLFVRLAWHASGTYDRHSGSGGSDGATMRFHPEASDGGNAGLDIAQGFLDGVKSKHPWISHADLWTLAGVVAIERMGGPKVPWKPGRVDVKAEQVAQKRQSVVPPNGRLPDASKGVDHLRQVFGRMGFNDREIVALSGAHTLGRGHADRSGYTGPWTFTPTKFSNSFFVLLLKTKWVPRNWSGPLIYEDETTRSLMMLPTDLALLSDPGMKKIVEEYAQNKEIFFKDFAAAFGKMLELGVKRNQKISAKL